MAGEVTAEVFIDAAPFEVFQYFTEPDLLVTWMGQEAQLDATSGGLFAVHVNGTDVRGRYLEIDPPNRVVVSWGFEGSSELPPGASTLEVRLVAENSGTRVTINHRLLPPTQQQPHRSGWLHYLAVLASRFDHHARLT